MSPTRPVPLRLADVVANDLEARILEGSLKPGDLLPSERKLALELGVSRPSLREAIQRLVSKGLLSTRHGGGTSVTDRMEATFADPWQQMLSGHPALQSDLLEFRHMLEGEAASLAAKRATDADLDRIGAVMERLQTAYADDDLPSSIEHDAAFHQAIAEASHNAMIGHLTASLMRVIYDDVGRNLRHLHAQPKQWRQIGAQHEAIWQAIRSGDSARAGRAARSHIEYVRQTMDESAKVEGRRSAARRRFAGVSE
jgi:GntR family transcriptional regulator, transcriptional repressor for pyruvate dehydrogenase complex